MSVTLEAYSKLLGSYHENSDGLSLATIVVLHLCGPKKYWGLDLVCKDRSQMEEVSTLIKSMMTEISETRHTSSIKFENSLSGVSANLVTHPRGIPEVMIFLVDQEKVTTISRTKLE